MLAYGRAGIPIKQLEYDILATAESVTAIDYRGLVWRARPPVENRG